MGEKENRRMVVSGLVYVEVRVMNAEGVLAVGLAREVDKKGTRLPNDDTVVFDSSFFFLPSFSLFPSYSTNLGSFETVIVGVAHGGLSIAWSNGGRIRGCMGEVDVGG